MNTAELEAFKKRFAWERELVRLAHIVREEHITAIEKSRHIGLGFMSFPEVKEAEKALLEHAYNNGEKP